MSRPPRETIMSALFSRLAASATVNFTADTQANSVELVNPSTSAGLFIGAPVFGDGIARGSVIASLLPLTMSLPAACNAVQVALSTGFQTTGRRLIHWSQVAAQPALFLRDGNEDALYQSTIHQQLTLNCEVWIYNNDGQDPSVVPAVGLNYLLDAVQSVFAVDDPMRGRFTLGGLVEWCRISGRIDKEPGDLDGQAIAVADVEIIIP